MTIAIIDCGSGNLHSVEKALRKVAQPLDIDVTVTTHAADIRRASHVVLPGVGAFADCMRGLQALDGMIDTLEQEVLHKGKPFLGICVGMQMLFEQGLEHGTHEGLGWLKGKVVPLQGEGLKIPHMGWNTLQVADAHHPLFAGIAGDTHVYFVHSYHAQCADASDRLASTEYGGVVCACVARKNITGTQFHPEKSQQAGLRLLENFIRMEAV